MIKVACGNCRTVVPLIARYNDPDLGEAERVLLSTHLLGCPHCLARLQEHRALDQRLRRMSGMTLSPQAREAVLERIAAPSAGVGLLGFAPPGRQGWMGAATALSLTAVIVVFSFGALYTAQGAGRGAEGTIARNGTANEVFARPLTTTILNANPTQVVQTVGESLSGTAVISSLRVAPVAPVVAIVREVRAREGYIVVRPDGTRQEERLAITRDTSIVWSDGRQASLADIATGVTIRVERDRPGGGTARQIILSR